MSALLSLLMICFAVHFMNAQTKQEQLILGKQLLTQSDSLAEKGNYKKSTETALKAVSIFEKINEWKQWYNAYTIIFYNGYYAKNYEISIQHIQKGIASLPKKEILIHGKMQYLLGFNNNQIGNIFDALDNYEQSILHFKNSVHLKNRKDSLWLNRAYGNICQIHTQQGDYSKAIEYLKIAIPYGESVKDSSGVWKNIKALGDAYFYLGDFENAKKTYVKAQQLKDSEDGTFQLYEAKNQFETQNYDNALLAVKNALRLAKECKKNSYRCEAIFTNASIFLGKIYLEIGQTEKALQQFEKNLRDVRSSNNSREIGQLHICIGNAQKKLKQYDEALKSYQKALQTFIPDFKEKNPTKNPLQDLWTLEIWLMEIFKSKGDCFYAKYENSENDKWLYLAEENYDLAATFTETIRLNFTETKSKLTLGSHTNSFYEELIKVKLTLFQLTKNRKYKSHAFMISQRANAFVLRELVNEKQALKVARIPKSTITVFENYKKEINILAQKIEDSKAPDSLQTLLITTKESFKQLKQNISKKYPKFDVLRNDLEGVTVEELQTNLNSNTVFIKYFLGTETLYIFSTSQQDFHIDSILLPKNFQSLIFQYRQAISDISFINAYPYLAEKQYLHTAHSLYNILLSKPLQKHSNTIIQEITMVPDGILNTIPFQTLLRKKSDSWTNLDNTIIKKYAIGYHYFCKMILNTTDKLKGKNDFASFGLELNQYTLNYLQTLTKDNSNNAIASNNLRGNSLSKLTFSDDEAVQLAKLMNGKSWINEKATKMNFIENATNATSIHLATHTLINTEKPNLSALVFTKTNDTLSNLLRLDEIYNHNFNSNMITLSACNTGFGKNQKGEGLQSLARAFNFSKIPSVTATLWSIPDASSEKIMKLYYTYLKQGHSKSVALQKAQLEYVENDAISSPTSRIPFYWSAWTHIGANDPIIFKQKNKFPKILFFVLLLLVLFDGIYLYRKY